MLEAKSGFCEGGQSSRRRGRLPALNEKVTSMIFNRMAWGYLAKIVTW